MSSVTPYPWPVYFVVKLNSLNLEKALKVIGIVSNDKE